MANEAIAGKFNNYIQNQNLDEITTDGGFNTLIDGLKDNVKEPVVEVKFDEFKSSEDKLKFLKEKFGIVDAKEASTANPEGRYKCDSPDCKGKIEITPTGPIEQGGKRRSRKRRSSKKKRKNKKSKKSRKAKKSRKSRK